MSCMNGACHIWMCHVTYGGVISHVNLSCHIWAGNITCEWVTSHMNESRHTWMSHVTYDTDMARMNESCHTYEWVVSHVRMSHVTSLHIWAGDFTCEWVTSHMKQICRVWMSHVTRMNESCHTYICNVWIGHVIYMNESCHTNEWVMSHVWMSRVTRMNESCHASWAYAAKEKENTFSSRRERIPLLYVNDASHKY